MSDTNETAMAASRPSERAGMLAMWALTGLVSLVVLRAVVSADLFPWWATAPTISPVANTSLTPAGVVLVNTLMLALSGAVLWLVPRQGGASTARVALFAAGFAAVLVHGYGLASDRLVDADDLASGTSWAAALAGSLAMGRAVRRVPGAASFALAMLCGGLVMIAVKVGVQVWVEIPQTVAMFKTNKGSFLAAHGWSEGSPMAKAFEHRLLTADASGWFGMSNVLATLGVWGTVVAIGAAAAWRRVPGERRSGMQTAGVCLLAAAGLGCLIGGGSKGGYAALAAGLVAWGVVCVARKREVGMRALSWVPWLMLAAVVAAVVVRGVIGERSGERSILFRWYYLEAVWRIVQGHAEAGWPWGTGPGDFRDAYAMCKNPLNPEEVSSPHNVVADFVATLGAGGVAWVVLWLWQVGRAGGVLARPVVKAHYMSVPEASVTDAWRLCRFVGLAIPTVVGVWLDMPGGTPESAATRLGGMVLAMVAAGGLAGLVVSPVALVMAGASAGMLGLIDLTPVSIGACAWFFCMPTVAMGPWGRGGETATEDEPRARGARWLGLVVAACAGLCVPGFVSLRRWEQGLRESFELVAETAIARTGLGQIAQGAVPEGSAEAVEIRMLAAAVTGNAGSSREPLSVLGPAVERTMLTRVEMSADRLREASAGLPSHWMTKEALSRLRLEQAELHKPLGLAEGVTLAAGEALESARPTERDPASAWAWASTVRQAAGAMGVRTEETTAEGVLGALHEAKRRDMSNLNLAWRLFELAEASGDEVGLTEWAREVVRLNGYMRMDPSGTRALSAEQVARATRHIRTREESER